MRDLVNPPAACRKAEETEQQLVDRAREAVSESAWTVGECASKWTRKYARGRTDGDFGEQIGMSEDQVRQRRNVWDSYGGISDTYPNLSWSHFYAALTWDDAEDFLQWADDNRASVAQMKAHRAGPEEDDPEEPDPGEDDGVKELPWTERETALCDAVESGRTVVANMNADRALVRWAKAEGRYVRIDRKTPWGNPYILGDDGERDEVIESYRLYFARKKKLQEQLPELRGKVLGCHCGPLPCHGDHLASLTNEGQ